MRNVSKPVEEVPSIQLESGRSTGWSERSHGRWCTVGPAIHRNRFLNTRRDCSIAKAYSGRRSFAEFTRRTVREKASSSFGGRGSPSKHMDTSILRSGRGDKGFCRRKESKSSNDGPNSCVGNGDQTQKKPVYGSARRYSWSVQASPLLFSLEIDHFHSTPRFLCFLLYLVVTRTFDSSRGAVKFQTRR